MAAWYLETAHLQRRLTDLAGEHGVPGAVLGVLLPDGQIIEVACGVLNVVTGVEVTTDSVFQIGSLTKLWTATLAVQLADEGLLDLDAPVACVLPGLRLSDARAAARITMRHLLTHSSGLDGDFVLDTGRGDDCVARYVDGLSACQQLFSPGAAFSYSNAGFILAGRVLEVVSAAVWDDLISTRLIVPLGLRHSSTLPEEALLWRTAMGHVAGADGAVVPASRWVMFRSAGPAARINSTAADVLRFVQLHLQGGICGSARLVSGPGVAAMQERQIDNPNPPGAGLARGLGWGIADWAGHRVLQHNGETLGQHAFLRVLPDDRFCFVLLTNGGRADDLADDLLAELLPAQAGFALPPPISAPARDPSPELARYAGRYERISAAYTVSACRDHLRVQVVSDVPGGTRQVSSVLDLAPAAEDGVFVFQPPSSVRLSTALFLTIDGREVLHVGGRAALKVA